MRSTTIIDNVGYHEKRYNIAYWYIITHYDIFQYITLANIILTSVIVKLHKSQKLDHNLYQIFFHAAGLHL